MDSLAVLCAPISYTDGTIGAWSYVATLPNEDGGFYNFAYIENSCFCYKGFLYIAGGNTNSAESNRTVITYAAINPADGTLGSWQTSSFCPPANGESDNVCFAYNDRLYIIGGNDNTATLQPYCYYGPINPDGSAGPFVRDTDSDYPLGLWFHRGVVLDGYVYVMGGYDGSAARAEVSSTAINPDGSLGAWSPQAVLPAARHDGAAWIYNGKVYYAGGTGYAISTYVATASAGVISSWGTDTDLPYPRRRAGAINVENNVYLAGWRSSSGSIDAYVYGLVGALTPPASAKSWEIYQ